MTNVLRRLGWCVPFAVPLLALGALLTGLVRDPVLGGPVFHFFVVTLTSAVAVILALLILFAAAQVRDARVFFVGLAFLGIAGIFLVHALTTPGALVTGDNPWVGFSSRLSLFVGAAFLALSVADWRPSFQRKIVERQTLILVVFLLALVAYGVLALGTSLGNPEALAPGSVATSAYSGDAGGYGSADAYSAPAASAAAAPSEAAAGHPVDLLSAPLVSTAISTLTVGLLALAALRYGRLYRLSGTPLLAGFLLTSVFLLQAQVSMVIAPVWHASWWEYHGLMLAAFGASVACLCLEYANSGTLKGVVEGLLLRDTIAQLQRGYTEVIVALVEAVEAKDHYTRGHTQRVAELAVRIGQELHLSPERLRVLNQAALLHDVGKIGVSDAILNKPGRLTAEEFAVVKDHPVRGHTIIRGVRSLQREIAGVRHHHERLDGSGYPDGLVGDQIPLDARIIAVADEFDALTSARSYRPAWPVDRALDLLDQEAGPKLDPRCVEALHHVLRQLAGQGAPGSTAAGSAIQEDVALPV